MRDWFSEDRTGKKEIRNFEEKLRQILFDELFQSNGADRPDWSIDAGESKSPVFDDRPAPVNMIDYQEPVEVVWNRKSGAVTFVYEDGLRKEICTETAIWLMNGEKGVFMTGKPTCWKEQPCMDAPEDGQT